MGNKPILKHTLPRVAWLLFARHQEIQNPRLYPFVYCVQICQAWQWFYLFMYSWDYKIMYTFLPCLETETAHADERMGIRKNEKNQFIIHIQYIDNWRPDDTRSQCIIGHDNDLINLKYSDDSTRRVRWHDGQRLAELFESNCFHSEASF